MLSLKLAPPPDAAYDYTISYYGKSVSDSITNGNSPGDTATTTTWISVAFPEVLLAGCLMHANIFLKGEPDVQKMYEDKFNEGLVLLKNMSENRQESDDFSSLADNKSRI